MDVLKIVTEWLSVNGYDGLYLEDECACIISDLMPCICGVWATDGEVPIDRCTPGVRMSCGEGGFFKIGPKAR